MRHSLSWGQWRGQEIGEGEALARFYKNIAIFGLL